MKKLLKIILWGVGGIVLLIGCGALFIQLRGIPSYDPIKVDLTVEATPARLERGKVLATMICSECHLDEKTGGFTGKQMADLPAVFGEAFARNITQDPVHGIGNWSAGDLAVLLRTGLKPNGDYTPPWMVKLPHMSDEDLHSIIAFLKSDDPWVRPQPVQDTDSRPTFFAKFLATVAFKPLPYPEKTIPVVSISDKVNYGKYLVQGVLDCYGCHSKDFATMDQLVPENSEGYLGGGNEMTDVSGKPIFTRNITMHPEHGIGKWSEEDFVRALRDGFRPDNTPLRYPMMRMPGLTEEEIRAIYAYLKTVPVLANKVPLPESYVLTAKNVSRGQQVYHKYQCYACHGEEGVGLYDLRKAKQHYPSDSALKMWIRNASAIKPGTKMPTWDGVIQEDEYDALIEWVKLLGERANIHTTASTTTH